MHTARKSYVVREEIMAKDVKIEPGGSISFVNRKGVSTNLDLEALSTLQITDVQDTKVVTVSGTLAGVAGPITSDQTLALKVDLIIDLIQDTSNPLGDWWLALTPARDPTTEGDGPISPTYIYQGGATAPPDNTRKGDYYAANHPPSSSATVSTWPFSDMFKAFVDQTDLDITPTT